MDPVTAVGLAAGILQFLEAGFKTVSVCREIYRDGSLAEHRDTVEISKLLTTTAEQLKHPTHGLPAVASGHDQDVIEMSEKCSKTAAELLSELSRLKQGPGDGFRQVVGKTVRAIRRKKFLAETQKKLESYRDILNIRILSRLDFRTVLHDRRFDTLDEMIKNLVIALNEGRNTYAKLIADQTVAITKHIDRRYDQLNQEEARRRLRDEFIESLFYPEISSRFDNIARSHGGTCQWFFESSKSRVDTENPGEASLPEIHQSPLSHTASSSEESLVSNSRRASGSDNSRSLSRLNSHDDQHEYCHLVGIAEESRARPWDSFEEWLSSDGYDPYWLSGKPGSGKSTLMKYVSTNFYHYCRSLEPSSPWSNTDLVIMCSFFLYSLGSSIQKNYLGLLKSLLYQIAQQWEDSIPIMSGQARPPRSSTLYEWTEERLEEALKLFLFSKPLVMRVCIFIDGLDEYDGDENKLMATIRLLSQSPGIKVCASSRPEEIFRQGFANCPHIRLQDLNYPDILKATSDRLTPALSGRFCDSGSDSMYDSRWYANKLIRHLTEKSQGIFLWAELMTKDIITGARNADTFSELEERLDRTPDTIDGLYMHMLERLDKSYVREASIYFHHILAYDEEDYDEAQTLLHFACNEESAWAHIGQRNTTYFLTSHFHETCRNLEIRILSRCAGLVEIDESRLTSINWLYSPKGRVLINQDEACLSRYLREIKFIHKTARDYVRSTFQFFEDSKCRMNGVLAHSRGRIAIAYLTPILMSKLESDEGLIHLDDRYITSIMNTLWPSTQDSPAMHSAAFQIIDRTYDLLFYLNEKLNGSRYDVSEFCGSKVFEYSDLPYHWPSTHRLDFASFFGRWDYIKYHMSKERNSTQEDVERVVSSAILGLAYVGISQDEARHFMKQLNGVSRVLLYYLPKSTNAEMLVFTATVNNLAGDHLKWTILFASVSQLISSLRKFRLGEESVHEVIDLCMQVITTLIKLDVGADINMLLMHAICTRIMTGDEPTIRVAVKETLLAFVKRKMFRDPHPIGDIEAFLCDLGATDRRIFHSIEYDANDGGKLVQEESRMGLRLTHTQSERLSHAYTHERPRKCTGPARLEGENFIGFGTEDAMPKESNPEADDIVQLLLS